MLPSVVVVAAFRFISRPAASKILPLVVVIGASTLMSRPQHTSKLPLVAVTAWLMLTSRSARKVRVVGLELADQLTASLMLMSPLPTIAVFRFVCGGVPA